MRYAYVLALDAPSAYARMTLISARSVRVWDPVAHVTLITDARSHAVLIGDGLADELVNAVDDVRLVDTPKVTATLRSRYLKTSMRALVDGDFLYLDSDTVVCGDLGGLPRAAGGGDLAIVSDQHRGHPELADVEERVFAACGWRRPRRHIANGGVLYWRDTSAAHALGWLWRRKWERSCAVTGRHNDQQALNSAIEDLSGKVCVTELPAAYNAQVGLRPETAFGARVWHVFSTDRSRVPHMTTVFDPLWDGLSPPIDLPDLTRQPHPFLERDILDRMVIELLRRRPWDSGNLSFRDWRRLWLAGDRRGAAGAIARAILARGRQGASVVLGLRAAVAPLPGGGRRR